jgi:hypothetical protein
MTRRNKRHCRSSRIRNVRRARRNILNTRSTLPAVVQRKAILVVASQRMDRHPIAIMATRLPAPLTSNQPFDDASPQEVIAADRVRELDRSHPREVRLDVIRHGGTRTDDHAAFI